MINILYEDNHLLVVEKPINMPVQADDSKDTDLLTLLKQYLKEKYNKPNNVYLGLVHRLDRMVSGVMVFAKTSKAASRLSNEIRLHQMQKKYFAIVHDTTGLLQADTWTDYLIKNEKTNMVSTTTSDKGKKAILSYEKIQTTNHLSLVSIDLKTGRPHQIRVQFSSRKHPLFGDMRYFNKPHNKGNIALYAYQLSFYHPTTKQLMTFTHHPPVFYPWHIFEKEVHKWLKDEK